VYFCRRWWRSQLATESVGGLPLREEPGDAETSDRAGDRDEDALLALRDTEFEKLEDVRDALEVVDA
jgi:hypothetical protein